MIVEFIGGPRDGHVQDISDPGPRYHFVVAPPFGGMLAADTANALEYVPITRATYRGPLYNADRAHAAYVFDGYS